MKNNLTVGLFLTLLVVPPMAGTAGPEKISFPPYQDHAFYAVVDRVDIKEVRDLYVNRESARVVKPGQPATVSGSTRCSGPTAAGTRPPTSRAASSVTSPRPSATSSSRLSA